MYGLTLDDFTYRDIQFRWVLSPNRFIYRIYVESELIGTIPVSQVRARMLPSAIEALYPICDKWMGSMFPPGELPTEDHDAYVARRIEEVRESFRRREAYPEELPGVDYSTHVVVDEGDKGMESKPKKKRATKKETTKAKAMVTLNGKPYKLKKQRLGSWETLEGKE